MTAGTHSSTLRPLHRPIRRFGIIAIALLGLLAPTLAQQIPALVVLPPNITASNPDLANRRAELVQERATLHGQVDSMNTRCAAVAEGSAAEASCQHDLEVLTDGMNAHIQKSSEFNTAAQAAIATTVVPNLADDPNAARLSAAQLRLVDGRIAILKKSVALLSDSNPEWARERNRVLDDIHEDTVGASWEGVNLLSLGLAAWAKTIAQSHLSSMEINALWEAVQKPLANLPSEEARLTRIMERTSDPALTQAIAKYIDALHKVQTAQRAKDFIHTEARIYDAAESLNSQFELMKLKPTESENTDGLYKSSAFLGQVAIVFVAEGPEAVAAAAGSAGASIAVGGRELVNLWDEHDQLAALNQNASDRNGLKVKLTGRLSDLLQERDRLVWATQHPARTSGP